MNQMRGLLCQDLIVYRGLKRVQFINIRTLYVKYNILALARACFHGNVGRQGQQRGQSYVFHCRSPSR